LPASDERIQIGKYTLGKAPGGTIWISCDDGEGGAFNEIELEAAIKAFYDANF